jgi:hypothetical protein
MSTFEAAVGGAVALLAFLAATGLSKWPRSPVARYGALFATSAAAYAVVSAPDKVVQHAAWLAPLRLLSIGTPAVFWLWAVACFDDEFQPSWDKFLPWITLVALGASCIYGGWPAGWPAVQGLSVTLAGLAVWQALAGRAGDLVETRRRFRVILVVGVGLYIAAITVTELASHHGVGGIPDTTFSAAGLVLMAFAFALMRLFEEPNGVLAARLPRQFPATDRPVAPSPIDSQEHALLTALRRLMEEERVYREEGFSIFRSPSGSAPRSIACDA